MRLLKRKCRTKSCGKYDLQTTLIHLYLLSSITNNAQGQPRDIVCVAIALRCVRLRNSQESSLIHLHHALVGMRGLQLPRLTLRSSALCSPTFIRLHCRRYTTKPTSMVTLIITIAISRKTPIEISLKNSISREKTRSG